MQGKTSAFFDTPMNHWLFIFLEPFAHICTPSWGRTRGSNKLLTTKCHLEETWNWNDCFQLSCVDAFRSQLCVCFLSLFFLRATLCSAAWKFTAFLFFVFERLEFYFLNFWFVSWNTTTRCCAAPTLMFTLIKFIGQQLRRRGSVFWGLSFSASLCLCLSWKVTKFLRRWIEIHRRHHNRNLFSLGRLEKSFIQQQHDFLRLKRTTNTYTSCDSRICYSQIFRTDLLILLLLLLRLRWLFCFLYFLLLRKCRSHLSRTYFVAALPQFARRGIFLIHANTKHSRAIIRQASKKRVSHNYPKSATTHYPHEHRRLGGICIRAIKHKY